jgi:hypothetical protein
MLNIIVVLISAALIGALAHAISLADLAPTIRGIADNIWSALFVAVLVVFYLDATSRRPLADDDHDEVQRVNYIVTSYGEIKSEYASVIEQSCDADSCSRALMYAVLIYENMNRPAWIRYFENLLVVVLKRELTVGIAQVRSKRPLSDGASIVAAAHILHGSDSAVKQVFNEPPADTDSLKQLLISYNPDDDYVDSVLSILVILRQYALQEF